MKSYSSWVGLLALGSLTLGCAPKASVADDLATGGDTGAATGPCSKHEISTPAHCECLGGYVKGDIGDGNVACAEGEAELERTRLGIEGAVCCKADAATSTPPAAAESCTGSGDCAKGQACFPVSGCDGPSRCGLKPEACTMHYDPVCGCDGKTYGNACGAAGAGVAVASQGECEAGDPEPSTGRICGTRGAAPCNQGEFCDFPLSASCGMADQPGTCKPVPTICTKEYRPVCGCDNKTYSTRCVAHSQGMGVLSESACK